MTQSKENICVSGDGAVSAIGGVVPAMHGKKETAASTQEDVFTGDYLPYIIKWGKITTWLSIAFILLPPLVLTFLYGAHVSFANVMGGLVPIATSMLAWYIADPIALFPILGIPGMYITYLAGNSKEIRVPAALVSLEASGLKQGTAEGTMISCFGIALSVYVSVMALSVGTFAGNMILQNAPAQVIKALSYLLPSLFGGMLGQRIIASPKHAMISIPLALIARYSYLNGFFKGLPSGGNYMSILICVFGTMLIVRFIENAKIKSAKSK